MRILYAVPAYKPAWRIGGPVVSVSAAAEVLVRKEHEVIVFATNSNLTEELNVPLDQPVDVNGVEVWYFKREEPLKKYLPFVSYLSQSMGFEHRTMWRISNNVENIENMNVLTLLFPVVAFAQVYAASVVSGAYHGPARRPTADLPSDLRRVSERTISTGHAEYTIRFRGSIDGTMTREPVSHSALTQGWQPNLYARLTNVGDEDVVNPWLTVNGTGDLRTLTNIVEEATRGLTSDADRARGIYEWHRKHRFHASTWDREVDDTVKALNVYGYTLCGDDGIVLHELWRAAGFRTRHGVPKGHSVTEVFYEGAWHLMDGDLNVIAMQRDNQTIAGEEDIVRDHDLLKRTHTYSIGQNDDPLLDQATAALYSYEGQREIDWGQFTRYPYEGNRDAGVTDATPRHNMHFVLRPGESLEWRWNHVGKEYSNGSVVQSGKPPNNGLLLWGADAYDNLRNGKWIYCPPLHREASRRGMLRHENVAPSREGATLRPAKAGHPARVVWRIATPYVLVGGSVQCDFRLGSGGQFRLSFSSDGDQWQPLLEAKRSGPHTETVVLDYLLSPRGHPMYQYFIQVEMQSERSARDVGLDRIVVANDVQMSMFAMPELTAGDNHLVYSDESRGRSLVSVTHAWMERTEWRPPSPPPTALYPRDGTEVDGTQVAFRWSPAAGGENEEGVADYRIQVSDRADMRWPLSPNFDKVLGKTGWTGETTWMIPYRGLLNPDTTYYWRVRAKSGHNVWGPWSDTWSFRCAAPGVPLDLQAIQHGSSITLTWQANPRGRRPVEYKVYGSNEKGFTASDVPYIVRMGQGFREKGKASNGENAPSGDVITPPNLITKVPDPRLTVVGANVILPNTNSAFYRVVAIDDHGNESGPSEYIAVPRPLIYTMPSSHATVGERYEYMMRSIVSIGHFTYEDGVMAFWHRERLNWTLVAGPSWLKIEDQLLAGTPSRDDVANHRVLLRVDTKAGCTEQAFEITVRR